MDPTATKSRNDDDDDYCYITSYFSNEEDTSERQPPPPPPQSKQQQLWVPYDAQYSKPPNKLIDQLSRCPELFGKLIKANIHARFLVDRLYYSYTPVINGNKQNYYHLLKGEGNDSIGARELSNLIRYLLETRSAHFASNSSVDLWWFVECFLAPSCLLLNEHEITHLRKEVVVEAYKQHQRQYTHLRMHGKLTNVNQMSQFLKRLIVDTNVFKHDSRSHLTHRTPHYRFAPRRDVKEYVAHVILQDPFYFSFCQAEDENDAT